MLQYEIFLQRDESEAIVFERYRDADAAELGLNTLEPEKVAPMDSIEAMAELLDIGQRYAEQCLNTQKHFGPFFR